MGPVGIGKYQTGQKSDRFASIAFEITAFGRNKLHKQNEVLLNFSWLKDSTILIVYENKKSGFWWKNFNF